MRWFSEDTLNYKTYHTFRNGKQIKFDEKGRIFVVFGGDGIFFNNIILGAKRYDIFLPKKYDVYRSKFYFDAK